jgi:hypothetical protein
VVTIKQFEVLAGDFKKGKGHWFYSDGRLKMRVPRKLFKQWVPLADVEEAQVATEDSVKRLGGAVGWGLAGGLVLGPVGLLAGLLAGGRGKDVTFICKLKDGRKFMAVAPSKVYAQISAAAFR